MMSESVTVTVQNGADAARPGQTNKNLSFTLNTPYFRTIPGLIKIAQLEVSDAEGDKESFVENKEEKEITEEEFLFKEKRREEWEKLVNFLKSYIDEIVDDISLNASINFYINDIANLNTNKKIILPSEYCKNHYERVNLVDFKTIEDKYLFSASWHCELNNIIIGCYCNKNPDDCSLVILWSLLNPLQPKYILDCKEKISTISFCPQKNYTDIVIGGCFDGKVIVWETSKHWFFDEENKQDCTSLSIDNCEEPVIKEATIATSAEKGQKLSIVSIQWLPIWCYINSDGNFEKTISDSQKKLKAYFATASRDATIFFWTLPSCLSTSSKVRSPLQLTIAPIYQLLFEDSDNKVTTKIEITCFNLILAKSEESMNLNIRNESDLERLRRVFVGTTTGEVLFCSWEGQILKVDQTNREICQVVTRSCVHDGIVRTMTKSPYLDDIFLTVGGRVFGIWKENFPNAPIFQRRSKECRYGEGCWSARSGIFILARLDGRFELWDLKEKCNEPVWLQTISEKLTPYVYPSPPSTQENFLAILDGPSTLRIFVELKEHSKDEDLERIEWFEEFIWRETTRKYDFHDWQSNYLRQHPTALERKAKREQVKANRKHEEAREQFLRILGIICMACGSPGFNAGHWFLFIAVTAFIMSLLWSLVYLFSVREALKIPINWILTELLNTGIYTILYFTAFVTELAWAFWVPYIIAGVFGIFNTIAYAAGTYFLYLDFKNNQ